MPSPEEQLAELKQRIAPHLEEMGLEGFILTGYMRKTDESIQRVCIFHVDKNPAYQDGLRPMIACAHHWANSL